MSYACLDDRWDEHPKYAALELEHFGLMACALVYCNRHLSDGFVPKKAVRNFGSSGNGLRFAAKLVLMGIWRSTRGRLTPDSGPTHDGFTIVGYLEHNPSRAVVLARRMERAEAGKRGGKASAQARVQAPAQALAKPRARRVASTNVEPSPILSSPLQQREISSDLSAPLHELPPPKTNGKTADAEFEAECVRAAAAAEAKKRDQHIESPAPLSTAIGEILQGKKP